jgi:hypothetical protein
MRGWVAGVVLVIACRREAAPASTSTSTPTSTSTSTPTSTTTPTTTTTSTSTTAEDLPAARGGRDPSGVVAPPVDADLAALPADVRLSDESALFRTHRKECAFGPKAHCEHRVDFDGDGAFERVFFVRARDTHHLGLAVVWAQGGVSLIGADARMRQLSTNVYVDDVELAWDEIESDFEIEHWRVAQIAGDGFATSAPRKRGAPASSPPMRAPARAGGGVFLSNSDSSTILYWDGACWRRLVLF